MAREIVSTIGYKKKNYIINGAMELWQRGTASTALTATPSYVSVDRFRLETGGAGGNANVSLSTEVPPSEQFTYSIGIVQTGGGSRSLNVYQRLDQVDTRYLAGKTVTISMWVKSTINQDVNLTMWYPLSETANGWASSEADGEAQFFDEVHSLTANTWKKISSTVTLPAQVIHGMDVAVRSSTLGDRSFYTTGWMMNEGSVAAPFERAGGTKGEETILCQRYYYKSLNDHRTFLAGVATTTNTAQCGKIPLPVFMRVIPAITLPDTLANYRIYYGDLATTATVSPVYISSDGFSILATVNPAVLSIGQTVTLFHANNNLMWTADAEL